MSRDDAHVSRRREAGELTPDHGARFVLEHLEGAAGHARYRVRIETRARTSDEPEESISTASIARGGRVTLEPWTIEPDAWALETVLGLCRTLGKNHSELGDWPGVLRRWRAPRE